MTYLEAAKLADLLFIGCIQNDGATISREGYYEPRGGHHYLVGGAAKTLQDSAYKIDLQDIEDFISENISVTGLIGGWIERENGTIYLYLDAVNDVHELAYAMKLADERDELAVYDVTNERCIYVDDYFQEA